MSRIQDTWLSTLAGVRASLDKQFAAFLRRQRGDTTHVEFARRIGIPRSSLYRIEQGEESVTLKRLDSILRRLRCSIHEVWEKISVK